MEIKLLTINKYFLNKTPKESLVFTLMFTDIDTYFEFNIECVSIDVEEFGKFIINIKNNKNADFNSINTDSDLSFQIKYDKDTQFLTIKNKYIIYKIKYSHQLYLIFIHIMNYIK
jgi:hypothetical protein